MPLIVFQNKFNLEKGNISIAFQIKHALKKKFRPVFTNFTISKAYTTFSVKMPKRTKKTPQKDGASGSGSGTQPKKQKKGDAANIKLKHDKMWTHYNELLRSFDAENSAAIKLEILAFIREYSQQNLQK